MTPFRLIWCVRHRPHWVADQSCERVELNMISRGCVYEDRELAAPGTSVLAEVLRRFAASDAYVGVWRPIDDEGDERTDAWLFTLDGTVEISEEELRAWDAAVPPTA